MIHCLRVRREITRAHTEKRGARIAFATVAETPRFRAIGSLGPRKSHSEIRLFLSRLLQIVLESRRGRFVPPPTKGHCRWVIISSALLLLAFVPKSRKNGATAPSSRDEKKEARVLDTCSRILFHGILRLLMHFRGPGSWSSFGKSYASEAEPFHVTLLASTPTTKSSFVNVFIRLKKLLINVEK